MRKLYTAAGIVVVLFLGGAWLYRSEPSAHLLHTSPSTASSPTSSLTKDADGRAMSSRKQLETASDAREEASLSLSKLTSRQADAKRRCGTLTTELQQLDKDLPRLEKALEAAATSARQAERRLGQASGSLQRLRSDYSPRNDVERLLVSAAQGVSAAARSEQPVKLSEAERQAWTYISKDAQASLLRYVKDEQSLETKRNGLVTQVKRLNAEERALADQLAAGRKRLAEAQREMVVQEIALRDLPAAIQAAELDLEQRTTAHDRLKAQVAAEDSRRAIEFASAKQRSKAEGGPSPPIPPSGDLFVTSGQVSVQSSDEPLFYPSTYVSERRETDLVQLFIFLEASGIDSGLDLLGDEFARTGLMAGQESRPSVRFDDCEHSGSVNKASPAYVAPHLSVEVHADGLGRTYRYGNETRVDRDDGMSAIYLREGPLETVQYSSGTVGQRFYDDYRGVTQFDFVDPSEGVRTFGEEPYYGNDFGQGWSITQPLWRTQ